jgi:hypothetical protein
LEYYVDRGIVIDCCATIGFRAFCAYNCAFCAAQRDLPKSEFLTQTAEYSLLAGRTRCYTYGMSDVAAHTRQRVRPANGDRKNGALSPACRAFRRAQDDGGSGPQHAERGTGATGQNTEGEPPRRWPGLRRQGADLNGWLRFKSAPLRYYNVKDA